MFKKRIMSKKVEIIMMFSILIFLGCGTMFKDDEDESSNKITIPKAISMKIPQILKENTTSQKVDFFKIEDENISEGYKQLKRSTHLTEVSQKFMKINLLLAEQIIDKVVKKCRGTSLDTTCIIEKNSIFFIYDDKFINGVHEILGSASNGNIEEERGNIYPLGKIEFTQYSKDSMYQYNLKIDSSSLMQTIEKDEINIIKIQWSKDESHILTNMITDNKNEIDDFSIGYLKKENREKEMTIRDNYRAKQTDETELFHLNILDKNDTNETFEINATIESTDINPDTQEILKSENSSFGQISNQGGFLSITSSYDIKFFKEYYLFDKNGNIISSTYCENSLTCDFNDPTTWQDINSITENESIKLQGTGGNLENSVRYLLFKPSTRIKENMKITEENQEALFSSIVGELYMYENTVYAILYSNEYINQLDELIIASYYIEDVNNVYLKLVPKEDKPTLYVD